MTVSAEARVDAGERSEADSPAPWVVAFEARLEARERAWRRGRWWGWVGMGVGNLVVADVFVTVFSIPLIVTMFSGGQLVDPFSASMVLMLPGAIVVWLLALALAYAIVRVMRVVAARGQG
ncbi:MAG: hypothetical protein ACH37Z_06325 [Anaerolineae bacterium]